MLKKEAKEEKNAGLPISARRRRAIRMLRAGLLAGVVVTLANLLFVNVLSSPKTFSLQREREQLLERYALLEAKIEGAEKELAQIGERNGKVYSSLFGVDTKSEIESYSSKKDLSPSKKLAQNEISNIEQRLDHFSKQLYTQSIAFDDLQLMAKGSEKLSEAIPAIWPIDRTVLRHGIGAYGMRIHPIYRRRIMHKGIDLACPTGSPVYATADGVIEKSQKGYRSWGYGQMLLIKHNFGYQTRYAHLSERLVQIGDTVRRGQIIGLIGSTGGSTGPHLHYEVIIGKKTVNPINFFDRNMSKEEYEALMAQMQESKFEKFDE